MSATGRTTEPSDMAMEQRLARLEREVSRLDSRLKTLEGGPGRVLDEEDAVLLVPGGVGESLPSLGRWLVLLGRSSLVLGGAFVTRAITESGALPPAAGVALGLAYAGFWALAAARATDALAASFHGVLAAFIAFPLLFEAVTRFRVLSLASGAAALVVAAAVLAGVAAWRGRVTIALAGVLGALAADIALLLATRALEPCLAAALAIAAVSLALEVRKEWASPAWAAALTANALVVVTTAIIARSGGPPTEYAAVSPRRVLACALALPALYVAAALYRMLRHGREAGAFEILQVPASLAVGLACAAAILRSRGWSTVPLGFAALAAGAAASGASLELLRRALAERAASFAWLGAGLLLLATPLALGAPARAFLWCALAVAAAVPASSRTHHAQAVLYLLAAAWAAAIPAAILAAATSHVPAAGPEIFALAAAAVLVFALGGRGGSEVVVPRFVAAGLAVAALGVVALHGAAALVGTGAAALSCAGMVIVAGSAIGIAALCRWPRCAGLGWLVYSLLAVAGLKLVFVDLSAGRALTLVVEFGAFGAALLLAPRFLKTSVSVSGRQAPS